MSAPSAMLVSAAAALENKHRNPETHAGWRRTSGNDSEAVPGNGQLQGIQRQHNIYRTIFYERNAYIVVVHSKHWLHDANALSERLNMRG